MEKINEFVNENLKEILIELNKKLFYDKAHFSGVCDIIESEYYKEILSYGVDIIPAIIDELRNGAWYILYFAIFDILDINFMRIPEEDRGYTDRIKSHVIKWWEENKSNYGK